MSFNASLLLFKLFEKLAFDETEKNKNFNLQQKDTLSNLLQKSIKKSYIKNKIEKLWNILKNKKNNNNNNNKNNKKGV